MSYFDHPCRHCGRETRSTTDFDRSGLARRIGDDIETLIDGLDWPPAPAELPRPDPDLSRYDDAFAVAAEGCRHRNAIELLYRREWVCEDCHRVVRRNSPW